jgi:triacylglycerol lipase
MQKPAPKYSLELVLHPERDATYVHFEGSASHPFEPAPTGFPRVNAWWLAEAALLAYWDPQEAAGIFQQAGLESEYHRVASTDCYLAWHPDFVLVAFRGTEPDEWKDSLTDANLLLVSWTAGRVHKGFRDAIDLIWPTLEDRLESLAPGRTVWFCGHSLGAALATLAADRYQGTSGVCTFGSPRVGNKAFCTAFAGRLAGRTLRYVNDQDVVATVPPPLFGYKHIDDRRFIAHDGKVSVATASGAQGLADAPGNLTQVLDTIKGLRLTNESAAPVFLLHHMPKAYAVQAWNDYDANG